MSFTISSLSQSQYFQNPNNLPPTSPSTLNPINSLSFTRVRNNNRTTKKNMVVRVAKETKLWGGRFEEQVTEKIEKFLESVSVDKLLYKHDIMGTRAHASMLAKQGLITINERDIILEGLNQIEKQIESGEFIWRIDREDVHMNIEASVTDLIGEPGKKLHTARSRNDQVATDFRLWCRDAIDNIIERIKLLQIALMRLAIKHEGVIVPSYKSLRKTRAVLIHHRLLAYIQQLDFDAECLLACRKRLNICPLGACALAGTGLPIDRFMTSNMLGFTSPMRNSMDAVSDRDFVAELVSYIPTFAMNLPWLAEEMLLWVSKDSSSHNKMPQKKHPDPIELVREKSDSLVGYMVRIQTLCKGLPLTYNRDFQEDKEPTFDSTDTIIGMLDVLSEFARKIISNEEAIQNTLPADHLDDTTLANHHVHEELSISEMDSILKGLDQMEKQIENGEFARRTDEEDVHMRFEESLTDIIGEPAKKLFTGRNRNNQVPSEFQLSCLDDTDKIISRIKYLQVALVNLATKNEGLIVPGYTHMQRAQPVLLPHHLLAYVEQLDRDIGRLQDCKKRMNFFIQNCIGEVSDGPFLLNLLLANTIIAIHLSRLGEEWVLWASEEFGFITPSDSVSTGSSIMPQKKNPDPMEVVRGISGRIFGDNATLLSLCKGIPPACNCESLVFKKPILDSVKKTIETLEVTAEFAQNITFNQDKIQKALPAGHLDATTLADYLVYKGIPFRTSHDIVGKTVALCVNRNCQLHELNLDELQSINTIFDTDVYEYLGVENSVKKFKSYGSTGPVCVAAQLAFWIKKLDIKQ